MQYTVQSDATEFEAVVPASGFNVSGARTSAPRELANRKVLVSVGNAAATVNLTLKPAQIAREEKRALLNKAIELGFLPVTKSTRF